MQYTTFASREIKSLRDGITALNARAGRELKFAEVCELLIRGGINAWRTRDEIAQIPNFVSYASSWYFKRNQSIHLFLPNGMAEFLASAARDISGAFYDEGALDGVSMMAAGINSWRNYDLFELGWPVIFIHFPVSDAIKHTLEDGQILNENNGSMAVIVRSKEMKAHLRHIDTETFRAGISAGFNDIAHITWYDDEYYGDGSVVKLLHGLSLYLRAFPDSLVEFSAGDKQYKWGKTMTIEKPSDVSDDIHNGVSPHYRRGHFRVLSGERFKNRGSVVFVKGCFVNGRAYKVEG